MPSLIRPDVKLNYQLMGPAISDGTTPVVLIHGLGANLAFWYLGAVRYLSRDMPLLLPDLRGHGASSMPPSGYGLAQLAEDVSAVMDEAGLEKVHLVGHSHGARIAMVMALANPDRIASLTIADTQLRAIQPPTRLKDWPYWPEWKARLQEQGVTTFPPEDELIDFRLLSDLGQRDKAALSTGGLAVRSQPGGDGAVGPARKGRRGINLRTRQMGARGAKQWSTLLEETTAATELHDESAIDIGHLGDLPMPVLLMYGAQSHCLPTSERIMEIVPGARRIVVPGAGHFFPIVKPRLFSMALRTFIAGVDQPGPAARRRQAARRGGRPGLRAAAMARRRDT